MRSRRAIRRRSSGSCASTSVRPGAGGRTPPRAEGLRSPLSGLAGGTLLRGSKLPEHVLHSVVHLCPPKFHGGLAVAVGNGGENRWTLLGLPAAGPDSPRRSCIVQRPTVLSAMTTMRFRRKEVTGHRLR